MTTITLWIDLLVIAAALASAFFWLSASRQRLRRISRHEELDAADLNRIITSLNRAQIMNARGALATGLATLLATFRVLLDLAVIVQ